MSHGLWESEPPILGKSATDFGKMSHPLRENEPQTLRKSATVWRDGLRRRMEIRNRLFQNISLNKKT